MTIWLASGLTLGCSGAEQLGANESSVSVAPSSPYCNGHVPDPSITPGKLCTAQDPNFDKYVYPAQIAHCTRKVTMAEKDAVAAAYGVARKDYSKYEFDHLISLELGGDDDITNLWPQPIAEAKEKDVLEDELGAKLRAGTITQADAVAQLRAWRPTGFDPSCERATPPADGSFAPCGSSR
jgi:hypothetical protein